ncbi:hypothetical protein OIU74_000868 [Salix koriyanagi]|uniref:Secreted protein n=1 Tax=Salix koriyanagi TaxID=2511006 RepID=A0A9Q0X0Y3_9ROSI|nr:hypothetical protein OIU74_000868 [Salix koriyanagi]
MSSCRLLVILGFPMDSCLACPTNRYLSCPPLQASNHKGDLGCKLQYFNFGEQQTNPRFHPSLFQFPMNDPTTFPFLLSSCFTRQCFRTTSCYLLILEMLSYDTPAVF